MLFTLILFLYVINNNSISVINLFHDYYNVLISFLSYPLLFWEVADLFKTERCKC